MKKKTLRLRKTVIASCLLTALTAAVVCSGIFTFFFCRQISNDARRNLQEEARYIAQAVQSQGMIYLTSLGQMPTRVTWIDWDGTVLYDTSVSSDRLENHAAREEVAEALRSGAGESTRYSGTLQEITLNYALRLPDGTVVRLSQSRESTLSTLQSILPLAALSLLAVAALATLLALRTSKQIVRPINRMDPVAPDGGAVYEELKPLVDRIQAQNDQIQQQVANLTQEHEKQDKFRRDFTANVSHELKTPLTSISGFAEIIRDGMVRPEDVQRFAGNIYQEAQRLIVLVGDIIKITQMDEKQLPINQERLCLRDLCTDVLGWVEPAAQKLGVTLRLEGDAPDILGARDIAEEMIYNLCDNAIKYNHPGGSVTVRLYPTPRGSALQVADTGIGIPKEHQSRVFERFYRVDKNRSRQMGGTGLGLSIVKHGALYHAASLELQSEPGQGTTVTVVFPAEHQNGRNEL